MLITHDACYYLGFVSKVHGFKGNLVFFLDVDEPQRYKRLKRVLLDVMGVLTPYFVEHIDLKDKGFAIVKLEGIDRREEAVPLSGRELYLPLSDLPPLPDDEYYLHELTGMDVVDGKLGYIGKVEKVLDYAQNTLIQLFNSSGNEVLIPIHEQFVSQVDKKARVVHVHIPRELLDINRA